VLVNTALAATLAAGSVTAYFLAFTILQVPLGVIGFPLGIVLLPSLSQAIATRRLDDFRVLVERSMRLLLWVTLFIVTTGIALRMPITNVLFGGGLSSEVIDLTAQTLAWFLVGLPAHALNVVLARAFYSDQDTRTPVILASLSVGVNVLVSVATVGTLGLTGLALGVALGGWFETFGLAYLLDRRTDALPGRAIVRGALVSLGGAIPAGLVAFAGWALVSSAVGPSPGRLVALVGASVVGLVALTTYLLYSRIMGIPELPQAVRLPGCAPAVARGQDARHDGPAAPLARLDRVERALATDPEAWTASWPRAERLVSQLTPGRSERGQGLDGDARRGRCARRYVGARCCCPGAPGTVPAGLRNRGPFRRPSTIRPAAFTGALQPPPAACLSHVVSTGARAGEVERWLEELGWQRLPTAIQIDRTRLIDLTLPEERLWSDLRSSCRWSINKARRSGYGAVDEGEAGLDAFGELYLETARRVGFEANAAYRETFQAFGRRGLGRLLVARDAEGRPAATLMLLDCGDRVVERYGASSAAGAAGRANYLVKWEAIRSSRERGMRRYDMWGTEGAGLAEFKASFGGYERGYIGAWELVTSRLVHRGFSGLARLRGRGAAIAEPLAVPRSVHVVDIATGLRRGGTSVPSRSVAGMSCRAARGPSIDGHRVPIRGS